MAIFETPAQADAFCALIALGFIAVAIPDYKESKGLPIRKYVRTHSKKQSYILYHDGRTDAEEDVRHAELRTRLAALGVDLSFATQSAGDKPLAPIILGQTDYSVLQGDILGDVRGLVNRLEQAVNVQKGLPLRGAYVGGLFSGDGTAELLDPSILYCYPPEYRDYSKNVEQSYQSAKRVTLAVRDFLDEEFQNGACSRNDRSTLRRADPLPKRTPMPESTENANLFASIHGMTQSIFHYGGTSDVSKVNMELALSEDTSKVASCIPCSMFMWANGVPATATHFGRGDNWNFPSGVVVEMKKCTGPNDDWTLRGLPNVRNWMHLVWASYDAGLKCLTEYFGKTGSAPSAAMAHALGLSGQETYNKIPLMFLEALTFESSFLNKMLNTLPAV